MSNNRVTIEDRLIFMHLMSNAKKSDAQTKRFDSCIEKVDITELHNSGKGRKISQKSSYNDNLRNHRPDLTAKLLSLMGAPGGLKFLTHDFDPNSENNMLIVIERANEIIHSKDYSFKIPGSLYRLFDGFINGKNWTDYTGQEHTVYLKSSELINWIKDTPALHPITSDKYRTEIQSFRNTVRISKPNLNSIFKFILSSHPNLRTHTKNLDKADFYTNVFWVTFMIFKRVLGDITQRDENAEVNIIFDRSSWQEYRLCQVRITHIGSEANPFEEVKNKLMTSGGALFSLMSSCTGYCDWSIEANFEGEFKRWRILNFRNLPEEELLSANDVDGFTHIFTFYKK